MKSNELKELMSNRELEPSNGTWMASDFHKSSTINPDHIDESEQTYERNLTSDDVSFENRYDIKNITTAKFNSKFNN